MERLTLIVALIVQVLPLVVDAVGKVEEAIKGIGMGAAKKAKAMEIIQAGLDTKNLIATIFGIQVDANDGRVMAFVDKLIEPIVLAANLFGIFETQVRIDTRKKEEE